MIKKIFYIILCFTPYYAHSQTIVDPHQYNVYTVNKNPFRLKYEVSASLGFLPLDAFNKGVGFSAGYIYHWTSLWAWEVVHATYQIPFSTHLQENLSKKYDMQATRNGGHPFYFLATTSAVYKPFFSKYAFLNKYVWISESFLNAGFGMGLTKIKTFPLFSFGIGTRFFISPKWSSRVDLKHHLAFSDTEIQNILLLQIGVSFNPYPIETFHSTKTQTYD
jgi:outer membrane beta-barrel protein